MTYKELLTIHLEKIEDIATRLLETKYDSAQGLWNIQLDLVKYQIQLREDIRKEDALKQEIKANISEIAKKQEEDWKLDLQKLQNEFGESKDRVKALNDAIILAKHLGNAFAWLLFKGNEQKIIPLVANDPNPSIPSGFSLQAMLTVATQFSNGGAGFPIIHDITNCLRIGDITFCNIVDKNDEPLTVEIKARKETIEGDTATIPIEIYAIAKQPKFVNTIKKINQLAGKSLEIQINETNLGNNDLSSLPKVFDNKNSQLNKQVDRMSHARRFQAAQEGKLIESRKENGTPLLPLALKLEKKHFHWNVIGELIIESKEKGYAARSIDDAFLYSVTYTNEPLIFQFAKEGKLPNSDEMNTALKEKLPQYADGKKNCICFRSSLDYYSGEVPPYIRPFFWYEIPVNARIDILWGRLTIIVIINISKIVEALELSGIKARIPNNEAELNNQFIPIRYKTTLSDNSEIEIQGGNLNEFANKIGFEFMSLDGFLSCVNQSISSLVNITSKEQE